MTVTSDPWWHAGALDKGTTIYILHRQSSVTYEAGHLHGQSFLDRYLPKVYELAEEDGSTALSPDTFRFGILVACYQAIAELTMYCNNSATPSYEKRTPVMAGFLSDRTLHRHHLVAVLPLSH